VAVIIDALPIPITYRFRVVSSLSIRNFTTVYRKARSLLGSEPAIFVACFEGSIGVLAGLAFLIIDGVTERAVSMAVSVSVTTIVVGILAGGILAGSGLWEREPTPATFGGHLGGISGFIIGGAVGVAIGFIIGGITNGIIAGGIWDGISDANIVSIMFGGFGGGYSGYVIGCNGNCGGGEG